MTQSHETGEGRDPYFLGVQPGDETYTQGMQSTPEINGSDHYPVSQTDREKLWYLYPTLAPKDLGYPSARITPHIPKTGRPMDGSILSLSPEDIEDPRSKDTPGIYPSILSDYGLSDKSIFPPRSAYYELLLSDLSEEGSGLIHISDIEPTSKDQPTTPTAE